jgi:hypothetical protein
MKPQNTKMETIEKLSSETEVKINNKKEEMNTNTRNKYDYDDTLLDYIENRGGPSILDYKSMKEIYTSFSTWYQCIDRDYQCVMEYFGSTGCRMIPLNKNKNKVLKFDLPELEVLYKELCEMFDRNGTEDVIRGLPKCVREHWNLRPCFHCSYKNEDNMGRDSLKCGFLLLHENVEVRINFHNYNPFVSKDSNYFGDVSTFVECRPIQKDLNAKWDYRNFRL